MVPLKKHLTKGDSQEWLTHTVCRKRLTPLCHITWQISLFENILFTASVTPFQCLLFCVDSHVWGTSFRSRTALLSSEFHYRVGPCNLMWYCSIILFILLCRLQGKRERKIIKRHYSEKWESGSKSRHSLWTKSRIIQSRLRAWART